MTRVGPRRERAFTLIEVIIAIALSTAMVVAVYSATRSMTGVAKRQQEAARTGNRLARTLDILHRDLRGWLPAGAKDLSTPKGPQGQDDPALLFRTTANGLGIQTEGNAEAGSATAVIRYTNAKDSKGFVFLRTESSGKAHAFTVDLFRSNEPILVEFFDGSDWKKEWRSPERPLGLRVTVGATAHYVRLG